MFRKIPVNSKIPVAILLLCMFVYGFYEQDKPKPSPLATGNEKVMGIVEQADTRYALDSPVPKERCEIRGPYPDHECTPGAVFPDATKEIVCVKGYTKTVRYVTVSTKKKIYASYGIPYPPLRGTYEADHLIPLALGGSNEVANLFPEAGSPTPGFKEKDLVENYLYKEVCAGRIELADAQKQIANDWLAVYNELKPEQVRALKLLYTSWADADKD